MKQAQQFRQTEKNGFPTRNGACMPVREAQDLLREADLIVARHDGIHRLHSIRACLQIIVQNAADKDQLTPQESAKARWAIGMMRYAALRGFLPPHHWRPAAIVTVT